MDGLIQLSENLSDISQREDINTLCVYFLHSAIPSGVTNAEATETPLERANLSGLSILSIEHEKVSRLNFELLTKKFVEFKRRQG